MISNTGEGTRRGGGGRGVSFEINLAIESSIHSGDITMSFVLPQWHSMTVLFRSNEYVWRGSHRQLKISVTHLKRFREGEHAGSRHPKTIRHALR